MIANLALGCFVVTGALAVLRVMRGPSLADRVVALDVALIALMCALATDAAVSGDAVALDLLVVISIVGFTATVSASRFIEHEETEE